MFDKNVYKTRQPTFWEDWRKNAILAFIIAVLAPALFGVAAAASEDNKERMTAELREAKQNSFNFVRFAAWIIGVAVAALVLFALLRLGFFIWFVTVLTSTVKP